MGKKYDATTKHLFEQRPWDWLALAGLPLPEQRDGLAVVDAELSSVTSASDKLIRVQATFPYLAHAELQASPDPNFDGRMLVYNVLARRRHRMPVRSIGFLLRPEALSDSTTGRVTEILDADAYLEFAYKLVRVWQREKEHF